MGVVMKSYDFLNTASILVSDDRHATHGDKTLNHVNIAKLWSAYKDVEFTAHDVAVMMALLKVARTKLGNLNQDDYVDGAGYLAIAGEIASE
jgi:hypothetical protein